MFQLSAYDYHLPEHLIAQTPASPRDQSKLMVVDRERGTIAHHRFSDLPELLREHDLLVANNTRVIRARLLGRRVKTEHGREIEGGKIEFLMLKELEPRVWEGLFHASAKYDPGLRFDVPLPSGGKLRAELIRGSSDSEIGSVVARFEEDPIKAGAGMMPLPPYIKRSHAPESTETAQDEEKYQTIYAKHSGSAAAPTAGLHFTDELRAKLRERGIDWEEVTLHVGVGTFRPVKSEDIRTHVMHAEEYILSAETASRIQEAREKKRRVIAVGTTAVRTLESVSRKHQGKIAPDRGETKLFIYPGSEGFQVINGLITNFHLPKSTLLMLVCAFGGTELILRAYHEAIQHHYRFYSYGDAMLIL